MRSVERRKVNVLRNEEVRRRTRIERELASRAEY